MLLATRSGCARERSVPVIHVLLCHRMRDVAWVGSPPRILPSLRAKRSNPSSIWRWRAMDCFASARNDDDGAQLSASSLRGAKRRSNPSSILRSRAVDCFASARNDDDGAQLSASSLREAKRRSNPSSILRCRAMDCIAEPVIGRAFARPVGSQ